MLESGEFANEKVRAMYTGANRPNASPRHWFPRMAFDFGGRLTELQLVQLNGSSMRVSTSEWHPSHIGYIERPPKETATLAGDWT